MSFFADIASLWGTGKTVAELQRESDELDAIKMNQDIAARARITDQYGSDYADQWWTQVQENETSDTSTYNQNVQSQVDAAFDEGLEDGRKNLSGFVGGVFKPVGAALKGVLLGVPVWVWLLAVVVFFFYFGGGGFFGRRARAALSK